MGQSPGIVLNAEIQVPNKEFLDQFPDSEELINDRYLAIEKCYESENYQLIRTVIQGWGETTDLDTLENQLSSFNDDVDYFCNKYSCVPISINIGTKFD